MLTLSLAAVAPYDSSSTHRSVILKFALQSSSKGQWILLDQLHNGLVPFFSVFFRIVVVLTGPFTFTIWAALEAPCKTFAVQL